MEFNEGPTRATVPVEGHRLIPLYRFGAAAESKRSPRTPTQNSTLYSQTRQRAPNCPQQNRTRVAGKEPREAEGTAR
ncbi:hypothetical protein DPEC_G00100720 [Dallia pectoralis]|uniref:Uncharacterized protein n=1 Tax=Dallia pectoralis TaxID=75939 RepID=A0ACC2GWT4_DALPE|nr:hypothetical protein DPEC_G00100720 [Dallia pectoralis]